jgi:pimeloyl-ACP methyl ester carboxylesterase
VFDRGNGPALVVIPGVQGRWEWMRPALEALSQRCRTLSYSLCGDFGSHAAMIDSLGYDGFSRQIDEVLAEAKLQRVALCGVSFGGTIAVRYAARYPDRVSALVLASAPGPSWIPSVRQAGYVSRPWLSVMPFCVTAVDRLTAEVCEALPSWPGRLGFASAFLARALRFPMIPGLMARRIRLLRRQVDFAKEARGIRVPTLIVTGDPRLDRVVPVDSTREYLGLIPGAQYQMMDGTGHLGLVTQPARFARIVGDFIDASHS